MTTILYFFVHQFNSLSELFRTRDSGSGGSDGGGDGGSSGVAYRSRCENISRAHSQLIVTTDHCRPVTVNCQLSTSMSKCHK